MDLEAARQALAEAVAAGAADANPKMRFRVARSLLRDMATQATEGPLGQSLADAIRATEERPNTTAMRVFAVVLVHALGVPGLVDTGLPAIQRFLERVLHHTLRRARYPFEGTADQKRLALERLHLTIEDDMRPLEPSIPTWIPGHWP